MKDGIEKRGESTLPMAEWIYGFIVRHLKALIAFGCVSLAVAVVAIAVCRRMLTPIPEPSPLFSKNDEIVKRLNLIECEQETKLSVWSSVYASVRDVPGEAETASNALNRVRIANKAANDLRRAALKIYLLPTAYEKEVANADEMLYYDPSHDVDIRIRSVYRRNAAPEDVRPRRIKRTMLAGWVVLNALFLLILLWTDSRPISGKETR